MASGFGIENLPYGVVCPRPRDGDGGDDDKSKGPRVAVRYHDSAIDLYAVARKGLLSGLENADHYEKVFYSESLNSFIELGALAWDEIRTRMQHLLSDSASETDKSAIQQCSLPLDAVEIRMPIAIGDYTDFYASQHHALRCSKIIRGDAATLPPAYNHLPIAYHGRASSVRVSGTGVRRPWGQILVGSSTSPVWTPTQKLDFELEVGAVIGGSTDLGAKPLDADQAAQKIFGLCIVNDWSARDIQKFEYFPLGPFNSKNFQTSISPWIVPMAALNPFRSSSPPADVPTPGSSLLVHKPGNELRLDVKLGVILNGTKITECSMEHLHWTIAQMVAHHTATGCNLNVGDLIASGTVSGPNDTGQAGCLLEATWGGKNPLKLNINDSIVERTFLEDGDTVTLLGWCEDAQGATVISFGECTGRVIGAHEL